MALHDEILREILSGRVPFRFKIRDLKRTPGKVAGRYMVGRGEYSEKAINTIPRNHSVRPDGSEPGDYVQKGRSLPSSGMAAGSLNSCLITATICRTSLRKMRSSILAKVTTSHWFWFTVALYAAPCRSRSTGIGCSGSRGKSLTLRSSLSVTSPSSRVKQPTEASQ